MGKIDYNNLRKITVFDICDDPVVFKKIMPGYPKYLSKEYHLSLYKESPVYQAFDLIDYADATNDIELRKAVVKEWKTEIERFFDE